VATDFPNTTLPVSTQCVATREIVTGLESMESIGLAQLP
jgi:hypothetical protein